MARIRTIKPEFFTSEQVADCSPTARLLFVGMWCFCDDGGVHPASIKRLKMEIFPADTFGEKEIADLVNELLAAKLLIEFQADDGKSYWQVTGWHHQKIEKPTIRHPQNSTTIRRPLADSSATEGNGVEGIVKEDNNNHSNPIERESSARAQKTLIDNNWKLPQEWGKWAESETGLDRDKVIIEARKFHNNAMSKQIKSANWQAEWKKWIYRTKEMKRA